MSLYKFVNGQYVKLSLAEEQEFLETQQEEQLRFQQQLFDEMREQRNLLLFETDWVMLSDNNISETKKEEFKVYRQTLRDLPQNIQDINNIEWPIKPTL